jgi:hypothetical protein
VLLLARCLKTSILHFPFVLHVLVPLREKVVYEGRQAQESLDLGRHTYFFSELGREGNASILNPFLNGFTFPHTGLFVGVLLHVLELILRWKASHQHPCDDDNVTKGPPS